MLRLASILTLPYDWWLKLWGFVSHFYLRFPVWAFPRCSEKHYHKNIYGHITLAAKFVIARPQGGTSFQLNSRAVRIYNIPWKTGLAYSTTHLRCAKGAGSFGVITCNKNIWDTVTLWLLSLSQQHHVLSALAAPECGGAPGPSAVLDPPVPQTFLSSPKITENLHCFFWKQWHFSLEVAI